MFFQTHRAQVPWTTSVVNEAYRIAQKDGYIEESDKTAITHGVVLFEIKHSDELSEEEPTSTSADRAFCFLDLE